MRGFAIAVITAQVLTQVGAFTLPALLPEYLSRWDLAATEAGWLIGAFFAAYVVVVPVLVSLTDRLPARRIYLLGTGLTAASHLGFALMADGFWSGLVLRAMAGMGWAGCYMPGLKVIAERLEGNAQSRAVSWHAAGVGIAGAISFAVAGLWASWGGAEAAFLFSGGAALVAFTIGAIVMPRTAPTPPAVPRRLLDFRPVLRNRAATGWIIGYTVHTWELAALRAWAVTFLTLVIARMGAPDWLPGPTALFTAAGLAGIAISITGNETAQRFGRARVVAWAMAAGALMSVLTGLSAWVSAPLAALAVLLWNAAIYLDSSALTAGTVQAAGPEWRGATMGLHSMCGYAGGFVGPVGVGLALDLLGPGNPAAWALAFGHLALVTLAGLFLLRRVTRAAR
jgi:MFS family permease